MIAEMARKPRKPESAPEKKKRNAVYVTLDDETEDRLRQVIDRHRIKPDRAAVLFTALLEFLDREGIKPSRAKPPE